MTKASRAVSTASFLPLLLHSQSSAPCVLFGCRTLVFGWLCKKRTGFERNVGCIFDKVKKSMWFSCVNQPVDPFLDLISCSLTFSWQFFFLKKKTKKKEKEEGL